MTDATDAPVRRTGSAAKTAALVVLVLVGGLISGGAGGWLVSSTAGGGTSFIPAPSTTTVVAAGVPQPVLKADASVVAIVTQPQTLQGFLSNGETGIAHGIVAASSSSSATILTTVDAVSGATSLKVVTSAGLSFPATVASISPAAGLVALTVTGQTNLPSASFSSSPPTPGDPGYILFSGLQSPTEVSAGEIAADGLIGTLGGQSVPSLGVLTAAALPGDAGAPVFADDGTVEGIVSDGVTGLPAAGTAFIGSDAASHFLAGLPQGSVTPKPVPSFDATALSVDGTASGVFGLPPGAVLTSVAQGGAAAAAGLKVGDDVISVNGVAVGGTVPFDAFDLNLVPGTSVRIVYLRDGVQSSTMLVVASH